MQPHNKSAPSHPLPAPSRPTAPRRPEQIELRQTWTLDTDGIELLVEVFERDPHIEAGTRHPRAVVVIALRESPLDKWAVRYFQAPLNAREPLAVQDLAQLEPPDSEPVTATASLSNVRGRITINVRRLTGGVLTRPAKLASVLPEPSRQVLDACIVLMKRFEP